MTRDLSALTDRLSAMQDADKTSAQRARYDNYLTLAKIVLLFSLSLTTIIFVLALSARLLIGAL